MKFIFSCYLWPVYCSIMYQLNRLLGLLIGLNIDSVTITRTLFCVLKSGHLFPTWRVKDHFEWVL